MLCKKRKIKDLKALQTGQYTAYRWPLIIGITNVPNVCCWCRLVKCYVGHKSAVSAYVKAVAGIHL